MKKAIAILLSLVLLCQTLPVTAMAQWESNETHHAVVDDVSGADSFTCTADGITFTCTLMEEALPGQSGQRYAIISGVGDTDAAALTFPARVLWHEGEADQTALDVKRVDCVMPESVTAVVFPHGVEEIGPAAEDGLSGYPFAHVTDVTLPDTLTAIESDVFSGSPITSIAIPASVQSIGDRAFRDSGLTAVAIPATVNSVGQEAFYGCSALETVTFAGANTAIGDSAFASCIALTAAVLPTGLTALGKGAFRETALQQVNLSALTALQEVPEDAFYATNLPEVALPASVRTLGPHAFANCRALTAAVLPAGLTGLGAEAFYGCTALCSINLSALTTLRAVPNGAFAGIFGTVEDGAVLTLPDGVETIGNGAFQGAKLKEVTMPASLKSMDYTAFADNRCLKKVNWPDTMDAAFTTLNGFSGSGLEELTIPDTVTAIGYRAFWGSSLRAVTVPPTVTRIDDEAFRNCEDLSALTFVEGSAPLTVGDGAFRGCTGLAGATVVLPRRLTQLGDLAFSKTVSGRGSDAAGAVFEIRNPALTLKTYDASMQQQRTRNLQAPMADPWDSTGAVVKVYYPANMTASTAPVFFQYMEWCREESHADGHPAFQVSADIPVVKPTHAVTGKVSPVDARVEIVSGSGQTLTPTVTDGAFTARVEESGVTLAVSRDGYTTRTLTRTAAEFTADWDVGTVTLTPVSNTGKLQVIWSGAGVSGANVAVFDSTGALAASGSAPGGVFIADQLPAGDYTVVAFAENPYFSSIAAESDLAAMGIADYVKKTVTVRAVESATCELTVPAMDTSGLDAYVEKADLLLQRRQIAKGTEFFVRLNYRMHSGRTADHMTFTVPDGLTVTSVSSAVRSYGAALTFDPVGEDRNAGVIYLGLRATKTGSFSVGAAAVSGVVTVPMGSVECSVDELVMELKDKLLDSRSVPVTLYSEPNKTLYIQAGTGETQVKTNELGVYTGTITLPEDTAPVFPTRIMVATEKGGSTAVRENVRIVEDTARITETYFIHAGRRYYSYSETKPVDTFYTYISDGKEKNKYWTYGATIRSATPVTGPVKLVIYMLDGSTRTETMSPVRSGQISGGYYEQEFACSVYIQQAGDHIFSGALIPNGYSVCFIHHGRDIALDAHMVTVIDAMARDNYVQRQQIIQQVIQEQGVRPGDADALFSGGYTISDKPCFPYLPADVQAEILASETAVRDALDLIAQIMCGEDAFTYSEPGEMMTDMVGAQLPGEGQTPPYDPQTLADDGFTVSPQRTGGDQEGSSYAVKPHDSDPGFQYADSTGIRVSTKPVTDAMEGAGGAMLGATVNQLANHANTLANMTAGLAEDATFGAENVAKVRGRMGTLTTTVKVLGAGVSAGFNCYQVNKNATGYVDAVTAYEDMKGEVENIDIHRRNFERHGANKYCMEAVERELATAQALLETLKEQKDAALMDTLAGAGFTVGGLLAALFSGGMATAVVEALNTAYDVGSNCAALARASLLIKRMEDYAYAQREREINCDGQPGNVYKTPAILDPSGIVYEAVESNVLSGVTATCYDVTGDVNNTVAWDASAYGQTNPQVTGETGAYAWDVPAGQWQVRFTKEGYANAATGVLPVPPPQTGLKTAMVSTAAPRVIGANAYPDYVELVFDQYMDTAGALTVSGYTAQWVDPRPVSATDATAYARVLHLRPVSGALSGKVSVSVDGLQNYAGTALGHCASGQLTVQVCPAVMQLNYTDAVAVLVGEDPVPRVAVRVTDSAGDPVPGLTVLAQAESDLFADVTAVSAVTDDSGTAVFSVAGKLPGCTDLTFSAAGASLQKTIPLLVTVDTNRVARPVAKVGVRTLSAGAPKENNVLALKGSRLTLTTDTPGAGIYYSLNDTCPCQDLTGRALYTGPITLNESGYYRIAAYKDGMEYSERLNIHVTVTEVLAGDVNGEEDPGCSDAGQVSALDMQRIFEHLSGQKPVTAERALLAADVNRDGDVNILDYQALYVMLHA